MLKFPNNKVYIGQTKDYKMRWDRHSRRYRSNGRRSIIDYAISKYGWKNIEKTILTTCSSAIANHTEEMFILEYKSTNIQFGYNMQPGGQTQTTPMGRYLKFKQIRKPILRYSAETGFFEKWYPNLSFAAKDNNTSATAILQVVNPKTRIFSLHKKIFRYDNYSRKKRLNLNEYNKKKQVKYHKFVWYVFNTDNNIISESCYHLKEIAKLTDSALQTIKNNIGQIVSCSKKYKDKFFIIRSVGVMSGELVKQQFDTILKNYVKYVPTPPPSGKPIEVVFKNQKKILKFNSAAEAARALSLNEKYVRRAASRECSNTGYYKNYYFNYCAQTT